MSKNNIFNLITITKDLYNENIAARDEINEQMNKEIEEKTKKIKEEYQENFDFIDDNCTKLEDSLNHYNELVDFNATFDIDAIGNAMALVMTQTEGEEYIFQRANHETYKWVPYVFDGQYEKKTLNVCIIIKKSLSSDTYTSKSAFSNYILNLVKEKNAIFLDESLFKNTNTYKITFYNKGELNKKFDLSRFPYIKDFINYVIQYCYENNLISDDLDFDKLEYLANEFINSKKEKSDEKVYVKGGLSNE